MTIGAVALFDAVTTHALASGLFDRVNQHEPKNPPGRGLSASVWVQEISPEPTNSGLANTSARVVLNLRIYTDMVTEPQDAIDPRVLDAADALMSAYTGQFELGLSNVRNIDLLGEGGQPLSAQAGYLSLANRMYRVVTITIPIIINDAWGQVA